MYVPATGVSKHVVEEIGAAAVVPQALANVPPPLLLRSTWYLTVPPPETVDAAQVTVTVPFEDETDGFPGAVKVPTLALALPEPLEVQ